MIKFWEKGKMNWPLVKAFGEDCLKKAKESTDGAEGMQLFKTVAEIATKKGKKVEIERLIFLKIQEHEFDIFRTVVFGKGADYDGIVYMDGAISQIGNDDYDDAMTAGFHLEYSKLKDIYDCRGRYEDRETEDDSISWFVPDPDGDIRRIEITSLCRLVKDADCSKD